MRIILYIVIEYVLAAGRIMLARTVRAVIGKVYVSHTRR